MAGSFGFHAEHYEISQAIGELRTPPAVRQAPPDWLIIADGFSCREQIAQSTTAAPSTWPRSSKWPSTPALWTKTIPIPNHEPSASKSRKCSLDDPAAKTWEP